MDTTNTTVMEQKIEGQHYFSTVLMISDCVKSNRICFLSVKCPGMTRIKFQSYNELSAFLPTGYLS